MGHPPSAANSTATLENYSTQNPLSSMIHAPAKEAEGGGEGERGLPWLHSLDVTLLGHHLTGVAEAD